MKCLKNSKGQFVVEAVLLMTVAIGLFIFATAQLREGKYLAKLVGSPWQKISGMIEAGVWDTPDKARAHHPNQANRSNTHDPR